MLCAQSLFETRLFETIDRSCERMQGQSSPNHKSGAPYVVRPARPRSYLDFEKSKAAAARRHYRGLSWLGRACRAGGALMDI